jgi:hypothetical protein
VIAYCIYLILILYLIYSNGFFKLFDDAFVSKKSFAVLFLLKTLAIPVFYYVYEYVYGGIEKFDSGKFYNDAAVISHIARTDFPSYLKILFGLQNDTTGSYDFLLVQNTLNWDNGEIKDFLYNDNRVLIRVHSLVHFISFGSIFVHSLFSCFISFIGLFYVYKTFSEYFIGKEMPALLILCFFPALWFYTGALLKEGLSVFILGCGLFHIKQALLNKLSWRSVFLLAVLLWMSLLLKPYLLFLAALCFALFFSLKKSEKVKYKLLTFTLILFLFILVINGLSLLIKHRSLTEAALIHQRIFSGVAKGGIFVFDEKKFIRLPYDSALLKRVPQTFTIYTIKKDVAYMYWEKNVSSDTLYCVSNQDTLSRYQLAYKLPVNTSNLSPVVYSSNIAELIANCYYYSLFYPLFYNAHNSLQFLASFENIFICFSLFVILNGFIRCKKDLFLPFCFVLFALSICLLIGIATPNSGAIFRYRSPAVIFLLLAALYFIEESKMRFFKRIP